MWGTPYLSRRMVTWLDTWDSWLDGLADEVECRMSPNTSSVAIDNNMMTTILVNNSLFMITPRTHRAGSSACLQGRRLRTKTRDLLPCRAVQAPMPVVCSSNSPG